MAVALSTIASQQANGTEATLKSCNQLLDYVGTHPDAVLKYMVSGMILAVHSDASYLSEAKARSRSGGHFYLTNVNDEEFRNGAVLTLSSIIKHIMASASDSPRPSRANHTAGDFRGCPSNGTSTHFRGCAARKSKVHFRGCTFSPSSRAYRTMHHTRQRRQKQRPGRPE